MKFTSTMEQLQVTILSTFLSAATVHGRKEVLLLSLEQYSSSLTKPAKLSTSRSCQSTVLVAFFGRNKKSSQKHIRSGKALTYMMQTSVVVWGSWSHKEQ